MNLLRDVRDAYSSNRSWVGMDVIAVAAMLAGTAIVGQWLAVVYVVGVGLLLAMSRTLLHAWETERGRACQAVEDLAAMIDRNKTLTADRDAVVAKANDAVARADTAERRAAALQAELDATPNIGGDIRHMCHAFGQDVHTSLHKPKPETIALRVALMAEEVKEYFLAEQAGDIVGIADGLADTVVIAFGTAAAYGIDLEACLAEVYRSNMTKVQADGRVQYDERGKVVKPDGYEPPQLADVIGYLDTGPWGDREAA